jgi:hypothetical protein
MQSSIILLTSLFAFGCCTEATEKDLYVELGVADMAVHRAPQALMRRQPDAASNLVQIRAHYGEKLKPEIGHIMSLNASVDEASVTDEGDMVHVHTNSTAYLDALLDDGAVAIMTMEKQTHGPNAGEAKAYGHACGNDPKRQWADPCDVDGTVNGTLRPRRGLFNTNTQATSSLMLAGDRVLFPDSSLINTASAALYNRTITLWFRVPAHEELANATAEANANSLLQMGNASDNVSHHYHPEAQLPRFRESTGILYSEGNAAENGISIYLTRNATAPYIHMFAWDHDNSDGNHEYGTDLIATHGTVQRISEGRPYWAALVFKEYNGNEAKYQCRLWREGWVNAKNCGEVHLPNGAQIPKHGNGLGAPVVGGALSSTRVDGSSSGIADRLTHNLAPEAEIDYVAIFNHALGDDELSGPFEDEGKVVIGQLCYASSNYNVTCQARKEAIISELNGANVMAGNGR